MNLISISPGNPNITFDLKKTESGFGYQPTYFDSVCNSYFFEQDRYDFGKCYSEAEGEYVLVALKPPRMSDPVTKYRLLKFNPDKTKLIEHRRIDVTDVSRSMLEIYQHVKNTLLKETSEC